MPYAKATVRVSLNAMVWAISTAGRDDVEREGAGEVAATRDGTVWTGVGT